MVSPSARANKDHKALNFQVWHLILALYYETLPINLLRAHKSKFLVGMQVDCKMRHSCVDRPINTSCLKGGGHILNVHQKGCLM